MAAAQGMTFVFAAFTDLSGRPAQGVIAFSGARPYASRLVAGRDPRPDHPHEFVANSTFAAKFHVNVGDTLPVVSWTRRQAADGQGYNGSAIGPRFEATLVGIFKTPESLEDIYDVGIFPPALLHEDIGAVSTVMSVRLEPGATLTQIRSELDRLPGGERITVAEGQLVKDTVRSGVNAEARGIWLMAFVAALGAIVALGQLLGRHVRFAIGERVPLVAAGYTNRQLRAELMLRAAVPTVAGVAFGAAAAVLASGLFPPGYVRAIDPDAGIRLDAPALVGGGAALLVLVLAWVAVATAVTSRGPVRRPRAGAAEMLARRAPGPAASTGTNFALSGRDGSSAGAVGTGLALTFIIAALVGTAVFATSLDRLVSDPGHFGRNFSFQVGDNTDLTPAKLRRLFIDDRNVDGLMILTAGQGRFAGKTIPLVGVDYVRGGLAPDLLEGALPATRVDVALGRVTARALHAHIGGTVVLTGTAGRVTLHVVGLAVVPSVGDNDGVGEGAVLTPEGLARIDSEPSTALAAIRLAPDASRSARREISNRAGSPAGQEDPPGVIVNLRRVTGVPRVLAALLGVLALITLVHALIVSIQQRRPDVAILRSLGADRMWVARVVHWQASVVAVLPIIVGVPLGLFAGRVVFRAFVDRIGARPDPSVPPSLIVVIVLAVIVAANVAAVVPAHRARRLAVARLLTAE